jgi:hypothetical protein
MAVYSEQLEGDEGVVESAYMYLLAASSKGDSRSQYDEGITVSKAP